MPLSFTEMPSPVGKLKLIADANSLIAILWENDDPLRIRLETSEEAPLHPVLLKAKKQLSEYFAGSRKIFDIPLSFKKGTPFQQAVWQALLTIPYGEVRSYKDIAVQIGSPKAVRAVGAANGKNPISIIAPCHRVIGANGKLVGFAGGLETKLRLLQIENNQSFSLTAK